METENFFQGTLRAHECRERENESDSLSCEGLCEAACVREGWLSAPCLIHGLPIEGCCGLWGRGSERAAVLTNTGTAGRLRSLLNFVERGFPQHPQPRTR
eukprot:5915914-Prymnesium_polylepis.1